MTLEEFNMLTKEQQEQALAYKEPAIKGMTFKCKPTYEFQSVEFEWEANNDEQLDRMFELYEHIVNKLQEIAPKQTPTKVMKEPAQKMASEKQLNYMDYLGIKHPKNCSSMVAKKLLDEHFKSLKSNSMTYTDDGEEISEEEFKNRIRTTKLKVATPDKISKKKY